MNAGVVPAYGKLIAFFEAQLPRSTTDDGVWKLPDGDAYYAYMLRSQTTTKMTPQQVHDLGQAEVARIEAEMLDPVASRHSYGFRRGLRCTSSDDWFEDFATARATLRYVRCTLGPVIVSGIFVGRLCPLMAGCSLPAISAFGPLLGALPTFVVA